MTPKEIAALMMSDDFAPYRAELGRIIARHLTPLYDKKDTAYFAVNDLAREIESIPSRLDPKKAVDSGNSPQ